MQYLLKTYHRVHRSSQRSSFFQVQQFFTHLLLVLVNKLASGRNKTAAMVWYMYSHQCYILQCVLVTHTAIGLYLCTALDLMIDRLSQEESKIP